MTRPHTIDDEIICQMCETPMVDNGWRCPRCFPTDDVPWWDAPVPRRWHRCRVQTTGATERLVLVDRCACGAIRLDSHYWMNRNSRKVTT